MRINQVDLVSAIFKELDRQGLKELVPRWMNACITAADNIVREIGIDPQKSRDGMGIGAWLRSDDTGLSSKFMAYVLAGGPAIRPNDQPAYPHDPNDFGRCYRFLRAVPEARGSLAKMAEHGKVWAALVANWTELEKLYESEVNSSKAPLLYKRMREIIDGANRPATSPQTGGA